MRQHIRFLGTALGIAVLLGVSRQAMAEETKPICPICAKTGDDASYSAKAGNTLVRGATNTLLGWTELIRQPADEVKSGGNVITGLAKGVGQGVTRTLEGAAEVLTFWVPKSKTGYLHFAHDCPVCMGKR